MGDNYYINRVDRVLDYIENNICEKHTLEKLATIAMFSKYHFHRIFKSVIGESLNSYIKRLRMSIAYRLLHTQKSISVKELAYSLGYNSIANFSRDFKLFYNVNPAQVKENLKLPDSNLGAINKEDLNVRFEGIRYMEQKFVVYNRVRTGYSTDSIPVAFDELYKTALQNNFRIKEFLGIGYNDPDYTPPSKCVYDACMVVNKEDINVTLNFNSKILESSMYAYFYFVGHKTKIHSAWDYIFKYWLLNSNYEPDNRPHIEIYHHSEEYLKGIFKLNLCLPIKLKVNK